MYLSPITPNPKQTSSSSPNNFFRRKMSDQIHISMQQLSQLVRKKNHSKSHSHKVDNQGQDSGQKSLSMKKKSTNGMRNPIKLPQRGNEIYRFSPLNINFSLYVLERCLLDSKSFLKQYGHVTLSMDCLQVSQYGVVSLKFNNQSSKYKSTNEIQITRFFIEQLMKLSDEKFNDFYNYYLRSSKKMNINLKGMISLIKSYTACSKIALAENLMANNSNNNNKVYFPTTEIKKRYSERLAFKSPNNKRFSMQEMKIDTNEKDPRGKFTPILSSGSPTHQNPFKSKLMVSESKNNEGRAKISFTSSQSKDSTSNSHGHTEESTLQKEENQWKSITFKPFDQHSFKDEKQLQIPTIKVTEPKLVSIFEKSQLEEAHSEGSSMSEDSRTKSKEKRNNIEDSTELQMKKEINKKVESIINMNNWTKKFDNLLNNEQHLQESISLQTNMNQKQKNPQTKTKSKIEKLRETIESHLVDSIQI